MYIATQYDFNTENEVLQEQNNKNKIGYKERKKENIIVSESLGKAGMWNRAVRVSQCSNYLEFYECDLDNYKKLISANFCHDRLCSFCNARKSKTLFAQLMRILEVAETREDLEYVFLTLTVRNSKDIGLDKSLDTMYAGLKRFMNYKRIDNMAVGYYKTLEITRNNDINSKYYSTYHSHFHLLIGVKPEYFKDETYIEQKEFVKLWKKALRVNYNPVVYVQKVQPKVEGQDIGSAIAEVVKYSVKSSDYLCDTQAETDKTIKTLAYALKNRRLIGYGKLFKEIKAELALQDIEEDNLEDEEHEKHIKTCPKCGSTLSRVVYAWIHDRRDYYKLDLTDAEMDLVMGTALIYGMKKSKKAKKSQKIKNVISP